MRLLFLTSTRIGDAVLSTGALDYLIGKYPGLRVTVACGPLAVPLFEAVPGLDSIIPVKRRTYKRHWLDLWTKTVTQRWDLMVDLRSSALTYLVPVRKRYVVGRPDHYRSRVEELGELFGLPEPPAPRIWTSAAHRETALRLIPPGGAVLAVGPASNWVGKQWPAERFAEAVSRLTGPGGVLPGARVSVLAAGHERAQAQPLIDRVGPERVIDLVGGVDLAQAGACLARCAMFMGNDSGLMHLSAAAGTPTLGLFGPTPDRRYAPWGRNCAVVRTPKSYEELTGGPSFNHLTVSQTMMTGLAVDTVVEAAEALWARVAAEPEAPAREA